MNDKYNETFASECKLGSQKVLFVFMRSEVCKGLEFLGVKFDDQKNNVRGEEAVISADDSKVKVVVIPTDEELMIATDTMNLL